MIEYYFQDHLRWTLGWETPNQAGAFLATLLPLCWAATGLIWRLLGGMNSVSSVPGVVQGPDSPLSAGRCDTTAPNQRLGDGVFHLSDACAKRRLARVFGRVGGGLAFLMVVAIEVWLWWALAKTYSRGAWVGAIAGAVVWGVLFALAGRAARSAGAPCSSRGDEAAQRADRETQPRLLGCNVSRWVRNRPLWWAVLARVLVVTACLLMSNFSARLSPEYTLSDRSALNRVDLWTGGLELIAASPLRGWGWGESGAAFMQWTQPLDRTEGYKSMVNSYLTVAVEAGLPLFGVLLAAALLPLGVGIALASDVRGPRAGAIAGLTACWGVWLACLFFSNLWIIAPLWIVPGLAAITLLGWSAAKVAQTGSPPEVGRDRRAIALAGGKTPFAALGATAVLSCAALWIVGSILSTRAGLVLKRDSAGAVILARRDVDRSRDGMDVYPDTAVLGETYGHELRRWLLSAPKAPVLWVQAGVPESEPTQPLRAVLAFGEQAARVHLRERLVWLVHPSGAPPSSPQRTVSGSRVVLPGIDPTGARYAWESWASGEGIAPEINHGSAADVRLRWPEVMHLAPQK